MKHLCGKCLLHSSSAAIVKTASDWKELQKTERVFCLIDFCPKCAEIYFRKLKHSLILKQNRGSERFTVRRKRS